jgi:[acyl-carrier-protein] S-malonyltransferase
VRWEESVSRMAAMDINEAIEVGHGAVLAGLVRRITRTIRVRSAADPETIAALGMGQGFAGPADGPKEKSDA